MAGLDVASRAARDTLALVVSRPVAAPSEAAERPLWAGRRDGQQAASPQRLAATTSATTMGPTSTAGATIPSRVTATMAADRALFTVLTSGRQSLTAAANLQAAQNAQGFLPFAALLGSSVPLPALPTTRRPSRRRQAEQAAERAKVAAAYADPRAEAARAQETTVTSRLI